MSLLRPIIREIHSTSTVSDPRGLAELVLARLDDAQLREALAEALPHLVRQVIGEERAAALRDVIAPQPGMSWRTTAARLSRLRLAAGGEPDWSMLRDCTYEHLVAAAEYRERDAERNLERARFYRRLADALVQHGVATVGELPEAALADAIGCGTREAVA